MPQKRKSNRFLHGRSLICSDCNENLDKFTSVCLIVCLIVNSLPIFILKYLAVRIQFGQFYICFIVSHFNANKLFVYFYIMLLSK